MMTFKYVSGNTRRAYARLLYDVLHANNDFRFSALGEYRTATNEVKSLSTFKSPAYRRHRSPLLIKTANVSRAPRGRVSDDYCLDDVHGNQ